MTPMKSHKVGVPAGLRRAFAAVAIVAVTMAGWHLNTNSPAGIGVMGLPGATADPTGPPGPTGGPGGSGGMNGSQFQPPSMPNSMPDYQGGINQPPLDQNSGISIYNTGAQSAPQQPGQQASQQIEQAQQPQHGSQIPDYQTATPYTQGPGKANPDFQAPQQGNQAQPTNQGQQQQPRQSSTGEESDGRPTSDETDQNIMQQCQDAAAQMGILQQFLASSANLVGGAGSALSGPSRHWQAAAKCVICPDQASPQTANNMANSNPANNNMANNPPTNNTANNAPNQQPTNNEPLKPLRYPERVPCLD
ncbi:Hypothetical protein ERS075554_00082 [Mycobacteroides abscessus]|nr:Hypothetical protein ERS075505_00862 [Mycobacteroides abscessus]CPS16412.1 Hypothetical protein ERS075504_01495 [Mycobacteroides abscessus]CPS21772.1 Hypothetical protein ERS075506_01311 [Mycobacteroides abscessus]CPS89804.1 Hypothetical protein ERS075524_00242 [Mycobacteroides abscessus]CPT44547.1 Hypothetical protein ERS075535_01770 [Mycobacteroides abscessus]